MEDLPGLTAIDLMPRRQHIEAATGAAGASENFQTDFKDGASSVRHPEPKRRTPGAMAGYPTLNQESTNA